MAGFQLLMDSNIFELLFPKSNFIKDPNLRGRFLSGVFRMQGVGRISFILTWMLWISFKSNTQDAKLISKDL